jgi:hypothetical protein
MDKNKAIEFFEQYANSVSNARQQEGLRKLRRWMRAYIGPEVIQPTTQIIDEVVNKPVDTDEPRSWVEYKPGQVTVKKKNAAVKNTPPPTPEPEPVKVVVGQKEEEPTPEPDYDFGKLARLSDFDFANELRIEDAEGGIDHKALKELAKEFGIKVSRKKKDDLFEEVRTYIETKASE